MGQLMSSASTISYFGYGSLVNLATLRTPYISAHPAQLSGWRRVWQQRPAVTGSFAPVEGMAFLSVEPFAASTIDGVVVVDHASSLPDLDLRETLYQRRTVSKGMVIFTKDSPSPVHDDVYLYEAEMANITDDGQLPQILRSYLDAVLQGFLHHFGEQGVHDFKATTRNCHFPILEDRSAPHYPRFVELSEPERLIIDDAFPLRLG